MTNRVKKYQLLRGGGGKIPTKADKMMCDYTICKLRTSMCGIHRYLRKLSSKNVSMKKKRRILSKPQVGKGIFTAIASFVLPALISLITKK